MPPSHARTIQLSGDLVVGKARALYGELRHCARRRDVRTLVLDFTGVGRVDSSAVAVVGLVERQLRRHGKQLELVGLDERARAAFSLQPPPPVEELPVAPEGTVERVGGRVLALGASASSLGHLVGETGRVGLAVAIGRRRMPAGSLAAHVVTMGVDAIFVVGLLAFLLGMTLAFQGAVQLRRFGAGVFVADMVGFSMVRELGPLMTAVILTGRTGAAIASELGTMKVGSEIDALAASGISPVRFLVLPRLAAITLVGPALTLMAVFIGILGGMLVSALVLQLPPVTYWTHVVERLELGDWLHGLGKSLVFAWIIGLSGCHLGLRANRDASSVGAATTRTVVVSIFFIIVVDAIFATLATLSVRPL
jgi:phospholipid/cholesterol/gamma-HCH transport system permease protein